MRILRDEAGRGLPDALRETAIEVIESHHERWDGRGYPRGLAGEQIPLSGRIVAVADVYDALRSERAYKPAFSHDWARTFIVRQRGRQFDPRIVESFLQVESALQLISESAREIRPAA